MNSMVDMQRAFGSDLSIHLRVILDARCVGLNRADKADMVVRMLDKWPSNNGVLDVWRLTNYEGKGTYYVVASPAEDDACGSEDAAFTLWSSADGWL